MGRPSSVVLCVFALLALSCQLAKAGALERHRHHGNCGQSREHQRPLDFLYFVQQWPGSVCASRQSCCYPPTGTPAALFSVHGLWPNYFEGGYPQCCDSAAPFDPAAVNDLVPELENIWDSLSCRGTDKSFWAHEWEKHGTCSEEQIGREHEYFGAAIKLYKKVNITGALHAGGIVPSDDVEYDVRDILGAIRKYLGYRVNVNCNRDTDQRAQLVEVWTCVDTDGAKLIDCPRNDGRCPRKVIFPSFSGTSDSLAASA